jgi:peptide/nickel transport system substrate-binding protein
MLANDAVLAWLYAPQWVTVANKRVHGLWKDCPSSSTTCRHCWS